MAKRLSRFIKRLVYWLRRLTSGNPERLRREAIYWRNQAAYLRAKYVNDGGFAHPYPLLVESADGRLKATAFDWPKDGFYRDPRCHHEVVPSDWWVCSEKVSVVDAIRGRIF